MSLPKHPVLLVDDESEFLFSAELTLNSEGIDNIITCNDSRKVPDLLKQRRYSTVVLDMSMPHVSGFELLQLITEEYPGTPVIIITALHDVELAVESMKLGAYEYILKPIEDSVLLGSVRRAINSNELRDENIRLRNVLLTNTLQNPEHFKEIITQNEKMTGMFKYIEAVAGSPLPILITGETGVGKELIAKAIHRSSGRKGDLIPVNVAGVDDALFSDTLFGHAKGAYTGATNTRKGLIEQAKDGTLFLDEIGDLSMESQVKLLRLIQENKYYPLGSDTPRSTNARIIVATHKDLESLQKKKQFRSDLYYRLQTHHVHLPALRDRPDDIPLLTNFLLEKAAKTLKVKTPTPPTALFTLLKNYSFPGNIRELEGMIFDAVSRHESGILSTTTFREKVNAQVVEETDEEIKNDVPHSPIRFGNPLPTLKQAEDALIQEALHRAEGNQTIAAGLLGLSRRALNNRLNRKNED